MPHQLKDDEIVFDIANNITGLLNRNEIDPDGNYPVTLYGIDKNGVHVDGTAESFHATAGNTEGMVIGCFQASGL